MNLNETPIVRAVGSDDPDAVVRALRQKVDEVVAEIESRSDVAEAIEELRRADERLQRLKNAERSLNERGRELSDRLAAVAERLLESFVESAADGVEPAPQQLAEMADLERAHRLTTRAIQRAVEHLIPKAEIALLRADANMRITKADALKETAERRARKMVELLRGAVAEEVVVPVDTSKSVSGELVQRANELEAQAMASLSRADGLEKLYCKRQKRIS